LLNQCGLDKLSVKVLLVAAVKLLWKLKQNVALGSQLQGIANYKVHRKPLKMLNANNSLVLS
jgi:hypothetical protein